MMLLPIKSNRIITYLLTILIALLLFQLSCKKNPTGPEFKNPREYTWTATQLSYPGSFQTMMYAVWASNPKDAYVCGFSILGGQKGAMFHYDGNQWTSVTLPSPDYNDIWEMMGFGPYDIWAVGSKFFANPRSDSAAVLHYDRTGWRQMLPSHLGVRGLRALWGSSSQNMHFASIDGKVIHFNGLIWRVDTLHPRVSFNTIGGDETRLFAVGSTSDWIPDDTVMCFVQTQTGWNLLESRLWSEHTIDPRFGRFSVYSPAPGMIYSGDYHSIFSWQTTKWVKIFTPRATVFSFGGSGQNNVLAVGWRSGGQAVFHWDGATWEEIHLPEGLVPTDVELYGVWTNGRESFIVGHNGAVSYVIHGK